MTTGFDDLTKEEKETFHQGLMDWEHETGQDIMTDEVLEDMRKEYESHADFMNMDMDGAEFTQKPENPYLEQLKAANGLTGHKRQAAIVEARRMVAGNIGALEENKLMERSALQAQYNTYEDIKKYWEREGLSEKDGVPFYASQDMGFDGTPSEYLETITDTYDDIDARFEANAGELLSHVWEADKYARESSLPQFVDMEMRSAFKTSFGDAYDKLEKAEFDKFLSDMKSRHVTGKSGVDYSREVPAERSYQKSAEAVTSKEHVTEKTSEPAPAKAERQLAGKHRGEDVFEGQFDTGTEADSEFQM